ncbi:MAG: M55 family metallopeptidase [Candidatus Moranbacteria bacterium]|nr:M55 family metallopeptidase [Candidatus Moranbacteria bacterium]
MKILIIADMEGIAGVCHYGQTWDKNADYDHYRDLMIKEVNVAIEGVFDGGASEVRVLDYHWDGRSILLDRLDPRAVLFSGSATMLQIKRRIEGIDAICFVGFHGRAGSAASILEHTMDFHVHRLTVNGIEFDEMALESVLASGKNIAVVFVSGDNTACEYAKKMFPSVKTVATKYSLGRRSGEMFPVSDVHENIKKTICEAVRDIGKKDCGYAALDIAFPAILEIEFNNGGMADRAEMMPRTIRVDGQTVRYEAVDHEDLYRSFYTLQSMGNVSDDE